MRYEHSVRLRNGETIVLRTLKKRDAGAAIFCLRKVSQETRFLLREASECGMTLAQEEEIIARKAESPREMLLGAFSGGELIGMAGLNAVGSQRRVCHRASIGVSLVRAHWGKGIGTAMMRALMEQAKAAGFEQIELEVVDNNERAAALYEKLGFKTVGRLQRAMKYSDGSYADLLIMAIEI